MSKGGLVLGLCIGVLFAIASPGGGQDLQTFAADAPSWKDYPDDDALVLHEEIALTLLPDGRVERYTRHVRKYFTAYEVDSHADPRIAFDSATQSLEILTWQTVPPSGERVVEKPRAFNQVTPDVLGRAPDYATVQEMVATHLGMEEGAVVEREYVVRDTAVWRDGLSGIEYLQSRLPVRVKEIRITVPAGTELRFAAVGCEPSYERDSAGGRTTHAWRVENVPSVPPGSVLGIERDCLPHLVYSTVSSWEEIARTWGERTEACAVVTEGLAEELKDIGRKAQSRNEAIRAIHEAVVGGVRNIEHDARSLGAACRPAAVVYESGYGHRLDKAVLLLAWLRGADVVAEPVLVSDAVRFSADVPCVEQVPQMWVVALGDGGLVWMDPLHSLSVVSGKDLGGRRYVRCTPGGTLEGPAPWEETQGGCFLKVIATIDKDGSLQGEARARLTGFFSPYYRVSGVEEEAKQYVEGIAAGMLGGVDVESFNLIELSEDVVALAFQFRRVVEEEADGILLELPGFVEDVEIAGFEAISKERRTALCLPGPFLATVEAEIENPDGLRVKNPWPLLAVSAPFGDYSLSSGDEKGGAISFRRRMEIKKPRIEPRDYADFRRMILLDRNPTNATLVLGTE